MKRYPILILLFIFLLASYRGDSTPLPGSGQPFSFRENAGQVTDQNGKHRDDIDLRIGLNGASVFVGKGLLHYQWNNADSGAGDAGPVMDTSLQRPGKMHTCRMEVVLLGTNHAAQLIKEEPDAGADIYYTSVLNGRRALSYRKITYKNVYPDIDWVLYTDKGSLKYDFVVHPGGNVSDIRIQYKGALKVALDNGRLVATTPMGVLTEEAPYSYEAVSGNKIASRYILEGNVLRFDAAACQGTLVIDPELRLEWGTYYGGNGKETGQYNVESAAGYWAYGVSVATDRNGDVYLYGTTSSAENIATTGAYQQTIGDGNSVYLAKFNAAGQRLWCTYYGGSGGAQDIEFGYVGTVAGRGHAVACDTLGNIYITGNTRNNSGIATPGAHQAALSGTNGWPDLFLARFDTNGNRVWATYLGNPNKEEGGSLAVTPDGSRVFLAGTSAAYPAGVDAIATPGAFIPPVNAVYANYTGFINCFNAQGQRQWGTYISDVAVISTVYDLILDKQGNLCITGYGKGDPPFTEPGLTTPGCHQPGFTSCNPNPAGYSVFWETPDAFLQKWDADGNRLWGTYYGDGGVEVGYALAADDNDNIYLSGLTNYAYPNNCNWFGQWRIATPGSYKETAPAPVSAFLVKFSGAGQRQWGTYYDSDYAFGNSTALVTHKDEVFCLFHTAEDSLATECAYQAKNPSIYPTETVQTVHLAVFNGSGTRTYATYFGGKQGAWASGLAFSGVADSTVLYMAGLTSSPTGIATAGSFKSTLAPGAGSQDAFLVKFSLPAPRNLIVPCFTADSFLLSAADTTGINYYWDNGAIGKRIPVYGSGTYIVNYLKADGCPTADTFHVTLNPLPDLHLEEGCHNNGKAYATVNDHNRNVYRYEWYHASGGLISTQESDLGAQLTGLDEGNYRLRIIAGECDTTLEFSMGTYPSPTLSISGDTFVNAGQSVQLWAGGAVTYRWSPETWLDLPYAATPVAKPEQDITYVVTGYNERGCSAVAKVRITVNDRVFVPNAFSPNGDGVNDEFRLVNAGYHKLAAFLVFNRFGEEVFSTTDTGKGWDGRHRNKPADMGTYHYYIRLYNKSGGEQTFKGDLTLIR